MIIISASSSVAAVFLIIKVTVLNTSLFFLGIMSNSEDTTGSSEGRVRDYDEGNDEEMHKVSSPEGGEEVDPSEEEEIPQVVPLNVVFSKIVIAT